LIPWNPSYGYWIENNVSREYGITDLEPTNAEMAITIKIITANNKRDLLYFILFIHIYKIKIAKQLYFNLFYIIH
jgi:hypothetical protein